MAEAKQRVLVLGGTGHIGAAMARHFDASGHAVRATGRQPQPRPNLADTAITQLAGDDTEKGVLEVWLRDTDLVVDAATPYPLWRQGNNPRALVRAARARMLRLLDLAAAEGAALIHVSSFTTLPAGGSLQDRLRLATVRGLHPYFEVKETVEREALRAIASGLRGAVLNPAACLGPYDLKPVEQAFIPALLKGQVKGTVRHPINVVDVRDVAASAGALFEKGFPTPRVPIFGHNITVEALSEAICAMAQVPAPRLRAPISLGVAGAYWAETAAALAGRKSPWPSLPILLTAAGRAFAGGAEQAALGVPIRPLEETLRDALAWYRAIGRC
ncbi:NAD-dependent epimerase/dehydratase family protein [Marimonas sp. MJW-29]|uniref:NAD-dependent epimerase/dehydratase family protein n=1 Tax=Sulfitobacter sediminis TaxID=3234186 RepID=A0ABV3RKA8_9RHOB